MSLPSPRALIVQPNHPATCTSARPEGLRAVFVFGKLTVGWGDVP
jgi:hypothetical protein